MKIILRPVTDIHRKNIKKLQHYKSASWNRIMVFGWLFSLLMGTSPSLGQAEATQETVLQTIHEVKRLLSDGQVGTALNYLDRERIPDLTDDRIDKLRGDLLMVLRRNGEALSAYNRAMAFAPNSLEPIWSKWSLLTRMGRAQEAIEVLKILSKRNPDNPLIPLRLAHALRRADRLDESVQAYRRGVALVPGQLRWRLSFARALYDVLDYEETRQVVDAVLQEAKDGSSVKAAAQDFSAILDGATTDKGRRSEPFSNVRGSAHNNREWAMAREKAWSLMNSMRFSEAEPILRDVIGLKPTDHRAHYDLGKTLMELARYEDAIEVFEKGIRLSPSGDVYPASVFRIGQCLAQLGRWAEAQERFERVRAIEDWRNEPTYSLTFPHKEVVQSALQEARRHAGLSGQTRTLSISVQSNHSKDLTKTPSLPSRPQLPEIPGSTPFMGRGAMISRDADRTWFQHVIPAHSVERDDLQAGIHEFIPLDPSDTFHPNDLEIFLVFALVSPSYDSTQLTAEYVRDPGSGVTPDQPVGSDTVLLSMNEQSGYFVLSAQEEGWSAGLYRVGLFMGDEGSRSTQVDEVWFRVVEANDKIKE